MFLAVSAFLIVARIDGQPESTGDVSLMQYVAQSEVQLETGADEHVACKTFCTTSQCTWGACKGCPFCPEETEGCKSFCADKSQCTWGACKGCSFCPEETEGCKSWCGAHASPWDEKCKLGACKGCEPCPEPTPAREDCKPWCEPSTSPWDTKCKLGPCRGCEPCPEPTPEVAECKPWCGPHSSPWDLKCQLDPCKGCEPCPEPTPSPATPEATPATPSGPLEWTWHEEYEGTLEIESNLLTFIGPYVKDNSKWNHGPTWPPTYDPIGITVVANRPSKRWSIEINTTTGNEAYIGASWVGVVPDNFTYWHQAAWFGGCYQYGNCGVMVGTYTGTPTGYSYFNTETENTVYAKETDRAHYGPFKGMWGNIGVIDPGDIVHFSLDDVAEGKQELTITRDGVGYDRQRTGITDKLIFALPGGISFLPMYSARIGSSVTVMAEGRFARIFE